MWFMRGKKGKSKYRNKKVEIDGYKFDSQAEGRRYLQLKEQLGKGKIANLIIHPKFNLVVGTAKICAYEADFQYYIVSDKEIVVEDVKGALTDVFKFKAKLYSVLFPDRPLTIIKKISGKLTKRSKRKTPLTREKFLKFLLCTDRKYACKLCGAPIGCQCQIWS